VIRQVSGTVREGVIVVIGVKGKGSFDLVQVGNATGLSSLFPNGQESREQDASKNCDHRHDDQQLNQRETKPHHHNRPFPFQPCSATHTFSMAYLRCKVTLDRLKLVNGKFSLAR